MSTVNFNGLNVNGKYVLDTAEARQAYEKFKKDAEAPIESKIDVKIEGRYLQETQNRIKRLQQEAIVLGDELKKALDVGDKKGADSLGRRFNLKMKQLERDINSFEKFQTKINTQVKKIEEQAAKSTASVNTAANKTTSGNVPTISKEMQAEIDKLEGQVQTLKNIQQEFKSVKKILTQYNNADDVAGLEKSEEYATRLVQRFKELNGQMADMIKVQKKDPTSYFKWLNEYVEAAVKLTAWNDKRAAAEEGFDLDRYSTDKYKDFIATAAVAEKYINNLPESFAKTFNANITKNIRNLETEISKLKNSASSFDQASASAEQLNSSIDSLSKKNVGESVANDVGKIGESADSAKGKVDALTKSLNDVFTKNTQLEIDVANGKASGKEYMNLFGINGAVSEISSDGKAIDTNAIVGQLISSLKENVILSLHNHANGNDMFSPSDIETFAKLYYGQGSKVNGIIADGMIKTIDFTGISQELAIKIAQSYAENIKKLVNENSNLLTYNNGEIGYTDQVKQMADKNPKFYQDIILGAQQAVNNALTQAFSSNGAKATIQQFEYSQIPQLSQQLLEAQKNAEGLLDPVQKLKNLISTLNPEKTFDWGQFANIFEKLNSGDLSGAQAFEQILNIIKQIEQSSVATQIEQQADATKKLADATKQAADAKKELNQASQSKNATPENTADVQKINQRIGELQKIISNQQDWVKYLGDALNPDKFKTSGKKEATDQLRDLTNRLIIARKENYESLSWRQYAEEILELSHARAYQEAERQNIASSNLTRYYSDAESNYERNLKTLQEAYDWHQKTLESSQAELGVLQQKLNLTKEIKTFNEQTETNKPTLQSMYDGATESVKKLIDQYIVLNQQKETFNSRTSGTKLEGFNKYAITDDQRAFLLNTLEEFKSLQQEISKTPIVDTEDDKRRLQELQEKLVQLHNTLKQAHLSDGSVDTYASIYGISSDKALDFHNALAGQSAIQVGKLQKDIVDGLSKQTSALFNQIYDQYSEFAQLSINVPTDAWNNFKNQRLQQISSTKLFEQPSGQLSLFEGVTESANRASESVDNLKNKVQEVYTVPGQLNLFDAGAQGSIEQLGTAAANALNNSVKDTNLDDLINQAGNAADANKQKIESFGNAAQNALSIVSRSDVSKVLGSSAGKQIVDLGASQTASSVDIAAEAIRSEGAAAEQAAIQKRRFADANKEVAASGRSTAKSINEAAKAVGAEGQSVERAKAYYDELYRLMNNINAKDSEILKLSGKNSDGIYTGYIQELEGQKNVLIQRVRELGNQVAAEFGNSIQGSTTYSLGGARFFNEQDTANINAFLNSVQAQSVLTAQDVDKLSNSFQNSKKIGIEFAKQVATSMAEANKVSSNIFKIDAETGAISAKGNINEDIKMYQDARNAYIAYMVELQKRQGKKISDWSVDDVNTVKNISDQLIQYCNVLDQAIQKERQYFSGKTKFDAKTTSMDSFSKEAEKEAQRVTEVQKKLEEAARKFAENSKFEKVAITGFTQTADGISSLDFSAFEKGTGIMHTFRAEMGVTSEDIFVSANKIKSSFDSISNANKQLMSMNSLKTTLDMSGINTDVNTATGPLKTFLERWQALQNAINDPKSRNGTPFDKIIKDAKLSSAEIEKMYKQMMNMQNTISRGDAMSLGKVDPSKGNVYGQMINNVQQFAAAQNAASVSFGKFNEKAGTLEFTLNKANGSTESFKASMASLNGQMMAQSTGVGKLTTQWSRFSGIVTKAGKQLLTALVGYNMMYKAIAEVRKGIGYVKEIDLALTELKKVTNETDATYKEFLNTASRTSAEIGSTVSSFTEATSNFARLGYTMEESASMAESAVIYKNVADGLDTVEASTEAIISTMKAFGIGADDTMGIVDRFNEVGNNFAITSAGIGEAFKRSASALAEGGNTIDESIGLVTAANSVIQNPEQVGTALKTLSLRIRGVKTELEEAGLETEGMAETTAILQSKLLALTHGKVDILIDEDTFKSTTQILREMSEVWEEMTDMEQAAALELIGGKRQAKNCPNVQKCA